MTVPEKALAEAVTRVPARWVASTPLVLVTTFFAPFTLRPRPEGDALVWLDPMTEETFVRSLAAAGDIGLALAPPVVAPVAGAHAAPQDDASGTPVSSSDSRA